MTMKEDLERRMDIFAEFILDCCIDKIKKDKRELVKNKSQSTSDQPL